MNRKLLFEVKFNFPNNEFYSDIVIAQCEHTAIIAAYNYFKTKYDFDFNDIQTIIVESLQK